MSTSISDAKCFGQTGSAETNATGGAEPYTYSWFPSNSEDESSVLSSGVHIVTVTDSCNEKLSKTITISQPSKYYIPFYKYLQVIIDFIAAEIIVFLSKVDLACNDAADGSATAHVQGGKGPYSYIWSPSGDTEAQARGLSAGTHTVTVTDDNGCSKTQSITITEPSAISLTTSSKPVVCPGGSSGAAFVSATGGTGRFIYLWDSIVVSGKQASNLKAGNYTSVVTDSNFCVATQTVEVEEPSKLLYFLFWKKAVADLI